MADDPQIHPTATVHSSAVVAECVTIGRRVKIGPNCTIGYEDFQFIRATDGLPTHVEHLGRVDIADDVEIQAHVVVSRGLNAVDVTRIGRHTKIAARSHIGHSCCVGVANLISGGVVLGGSVQMGDTNFVGLNCSIKPGRRIGSFNLIGMGAVVITDIPDHEIWVGNPARKLRDNTMFRC